MIGAARSECTLSLYRALESKGIPIITYSSTSSVLSHKSNFPNLFRVCSSDYHQALALSDLIEKYSWEKLGIVGSKGIYGQELSNRMKNELTRRSIKVTSRQEFKEGDIDMEEQVKMVISYLFTYFICRHMTSDIKSYYKMILIKVCLLGVYYIETRHCVNMHNWTLDSLV